MLPMHILLYRMFVICIFCPCGSHVPIPIWFKVVLYWEPSLYNAYHSISCYPIDLDYNVYGTTLTLMLQYVSTIATSPQKQWLVNYIATVNYCGSRKYPYSPQRIFLVWHTPTRELHGTPPTLWNFQVFFFCLGLTTPRKFHLRNGRTAENPPKS